MNKGAFFTPRAKQQSMKSQQRNTILVRKSNKHFQLAQ